MMTPMSATEVRNQWSSVCDDVIHRSPKFIRRTRDDMILSNLKTFIYILEAYKFSAETFIEDDGSVTISLDQIDLVENGIDKQDALLQMGKAIYEYAEDYCTYYEMFANSKNRKAHLPYVLKALSINDPKKIGGSIICRAGKI